MLVTIIERTTLHGTRVSTWMIEPTGLVMHGSILISEDVMKFPENQGHSGGLIIVIRT